jgi:hypothetical protein
MTSTTENVSEEIFHKYLHEDIDKPIKNSKTQWLNDRKRKSELSNRGHAAVWAETTINKRISIIIIQIYLNFKKNSLNVSEYTKLKNLACEGIKQYWTRNITVNGETYNVRAQENHRDVNAIPVDLYIERDKKYARSMNPGTLGIDASFIYNK